MRISERSITALVASVFLLCLLATGTGCKGGAVKTDPEALPRLPRPLNPVVDARFVETGKSVILPTDSGELLMAQERAMGLFSPMVEEEGVFLRLGGRLVGISVIEDGAFENPLGWHAYIGKVRNFNFEGYLLCAESEDAVQNLGCMRRHAAAFQQKHRGALRLKILSNENQLDFGVFEGISLYLDYSDADVAVMGLDSMKLTTLRGLTFPMGVRDMDVSLRVLSRFLLLHHVGFRETTVSDAMLSVLAAIPTIDSLHIFHGDLEVEAVRRLGKMNLRRLALDNTIVTGTLAPLGLLSRLEWLSLNAVDFDEGEQLGFLRRLRKLKTLDLNGCPLVSRGLIRILSRLPELRYLRLSGSKRMNDAVLSLLSVFPSLRRVEVKGTAVTCHGISALQKKVPRLTIISDSCS